MEVGGKMGVHLDGSMGAGVSRLEVIEGPSGRRWVRLTRRRRRHGTGTSRLSQWIQQVGRAVALPDFGTMHGEADPKPDSIGENGKPFDCALEPGATA